MKLCVSCGQWFVTAEQHQSRCNAPACRREVRAARNYATKNRRKAAKARRLANG